MKKITLLFFVFVLIAVLSACNSDSSNNNSATTSSTTKTNEPDHKSKEETVKKEKKPGMAEYEKIKIGDSITGEGGMTLKEVSAILGGSPSSTSNSESSGIKVILADWSAKGDLGANITVTFTNGKATDKANFGLK